MGASSTEEIAAQHQAAVALVEDSMPCAPRQRLGPISLEDKEQPTYLLMADHENSQDEEKKELSKITDRYNSQLSPYYAASRLWVML